MDDVDVEGVVRAFERAYAGAIRGKDVAALMELVDADVSVLSEWGDVMHGQEEVRGKLAPAFARMPAELPLEIVPLHWKRVTDAVIVSHCRVEKQGDWGVGGDRLACTRVLVRRGDRWLLAATQVSEISHASDPRGG